MASKRSRSPSSSSSLSSSSSSKETEGKRTSKRNRVPVRADGVFPCGLCKKMFPNGIELHSHYETCHKNESTSTTVTENKGKEEGKEKKKSPKIDPIIQRWRDYRGVDAKLKRIREWAAGPAINMQKKKITEALDDLKVAFGDFHGRDYRLLTKDERAEIDSLIAKIIRTGRELLIEYCPLSYGDQGFLEAHFETMFMQNDVKIVLDKDEKRLQKEMVTLFKKHYVPLDPFEAQHLLRTLEWDDLKPETKGFSEPVLICFDTATAKKSKYCRRMECVCIVTRSQILPYIIFNRYDIYGEKIEFPKGPCIFQAELTAQFIDEDNYEALHMNTSAGLLAENGFPVNCANLAISKSFDPRLIFGPYYAASLEEDIPCDSCLITKNNGSDNDDDEEKGSDDDNNFENDPNACCPECFGTGITQRAEGSDRTNKWKFIQTMEAWFKDNQDDITNATLLILPIAEVQDRIINELIQSESSLSLLSTSLPDSAVKKISSALFDWLNMPEASGCIGRISIAIQYINKESADDHIKRSKDSKSGIPEQDELKDSVTLAIVSRKGLIKCALDDCIKRITRSDESELLKSSSSSSSSSSSLVNELD